MKQKKYQMDYIRVISMLVIIVYHFVTTCYSYGIQNKAVSVLMNFERVNYGEVATNMFFLLSGAGLLLSSQKDFSIQKYYKKRFWKTYPLFWICYLVIFCFHYYFTQNLTAEPRWKLIFSVLGIDGWLKQYTGNYYLIGEWFLGALLIIYLFFPLFFYLRKTYPGGVLLGGSLILYIGAIVTDTGKYPIYMNLFVCTFNFVLGMYIMQILEKSNKIVTMLSIFVIMAFGVKLGTEYVNETVKETIAAVCVFIILWNISSYLKRSRLLETAVSYISKYSYVIFLVHHYVLERMLYKFKGGVVSGFELLIIFTACFFVILALAKLFCNLEERIRVTIGC